MQNTKRMGITTEYCPFCQIEHEIHKISSEATIEIKGELVNYVEVGFLCPITKNEDGNTWAHGRMFDENLLRARDAYRIKHNLLTSAQIIGIREKYGLTQKELSNLIGGGDVTVARYETKSIQEEIFDSQLRMVMSSPTFAFDQLVKHKGLFDEARFERIKLLLKDMIKADNNSQLLYQAISNRYIDYDEECDANGNVILDIDKVANMIAYFAKHIRQLYKVKLMKLLWYCDVLSFNKYNRAMTGLVYEHKPYGALPLAHNEIIQLPTVRVIEESSDEKISFHIVPLDNPVEPVFTLEEQEILSKVALRFKNMSGTAISEYMHEEDAYKDTDENEVILYSMTSNIVMF